MKIAAAQRCPYSLCSPVNRNMGPSGAHLEYVEYVFSVMSDGSAVVGVCTVGGRDVMIHFAAGATAASVRHRFQILDELEIPQPPPSPPPPQPPPTVPQPAPPPGKATPPPPSPPPSEPGQGQVPRAGPADNGAEEGSDQNAAAANAAGPGHEQAEAAPGAAGEQPVPAGGTAGAASSTDGGAAGAG